MGVEGLKSGTGSRHQLYSWGGAPRALLLAVLLAMSACVQQPRSIGPSPLPTIGTPVPSASASPRQGAQIMPNSCGQTPIYKGAIPNWASDNAPATLPYVIATPDIAMGYLFSYPLRSGPDGNKILWYVRLPRDSQSLTGEGHPIGSPTPVARFSKQADSGPGEIYPSGPAVSLPGCWHFTLTWNGHSAAVDLLFK